MIYLISNIHRSGSSMMMRCLEAGGLIPVYDGNDDQMNGSAPSDYIPNPNGFYQFTHQITQDFAQIYDGKLIKCPIRELAKLPQGQYKLVFVRRNPAQIRASMKAWKPYKSWGRDEVITYFYDLYIDTVIASLKLRGDMDITVLKYADIVANPTLEFSKLSSWGVNVSEMVKMVQPELFRFKLEDK